MSFKPFGVIPAMITPLTKEGEVNQSALRKLVDFLIAGGVHGIFAVGTTGEFYALSNQEYRLVLSVVKDQAGGRVPIYAGASHITTRGSIELARIAQEVGVDALSVLTPMFITPNQEQVYRHFADIAHSTSLPVILYNNKPKTYVDITPATAARLAQIDNIVGIKDSTGDMTNSGEYIRLTKGMDFCVLMGRDTMIHSGLCYGATGAIASCANVAPRIVADIYDLYMAGDLEGSLAAQYRLAPLRIAFSLGTFPAVIKAGLELLGIEAGPCYAPVGPLTDEERSKLRDVLVQMGLLA